MGREDCKFFENCEAPMCPLDQEKEKCIWYIGEGFCRLAKFKNEVFVKNQRRLSGRFGFKPRSNDPQFNLGYFTYEMLTKGPISLRKGLRGLDPNRAEEEQLRRWLSVKSNYVKLEECEEGKEEKPVRKKRILSKEHIRKMQEGRKRKKKGGG